MWRVLSWGCVLVSLALTGCGTTPVSVTGRVVDSITQAPIVKADVCELDFKATPPCVKSATKGAFQWYVTPGEPLTVTVEKPGFESSIVMVSPMDADQPRSLEFRLNNRERFFKVYSVAGVALEAEKGRILVDIKSPGVRLNVSSGDSPAYFINPVELSAKNIGDRGTPGQGLVAFFGIPPGQVTLTVEHETKTCVPASRRVVVRAGFVTQVSDVQCQ